MPSSHASTSMPSPFWLPAQHAAFTLGLTHRWQGRSGAEPAMNEPPVWRVDPHECLERQLRLWTLWVRRPVRRKRLPRLRAEAARSCRGTLNCRPCRVGGSWPARTTPRTNSLPLRPVSPCRPCGPCGPAGPGSFGSRGTGRAGITLDTLLVPGDRLLIGAARPHRSRRCGCHPSGWASLVLDGVAGVACGFIGAPETGIRPSGRRLNPPSPVSQPDRDRSPEGPENLATIRIAPLTTTLWSCTRLPSSSFPPRLVLKQSPELSSAGRPWS